MGRKRMGITPEEMKSRHAKKRSEKRKASGDARARANLEQVNSAAPVEEPGNTVVVRTAGDRPPWPVEGDVPDVPGSQPSASPDDEDSTVSDSAKRDPQHTFEAAAVKLSHFRETLRPQSSEVFAVQLTVSEEHNEASSDIIAVNRSLDGALQAAVKCLDDYGAFVGILDELDWSDEDVSVLGGETVVYAFVHQAAMGQDKIYFHYVDEEAEGVQYEVEIKKLALGI